MHEMRTEISFLSPTFPGKLKKPVLIHGRRAGRQEDCSAGRSYCYRNPWAGGIDAMMLASGPVRLAVLVLFMVPFGPGLLWTAATEAAPLGSDLLAAVLNKPVPENVGDLRAIQNQVRRVIDRVTACTVSVRVGPAQGSGVIVSEDGYVLTAGHVSRDAENAVSVVLPDGRRLKAKTLGSNRDIDSGLIKITDPGKWPFVTLGHSAELQKGQWCLTVGHPGGYQPGRTPVVRLGRILEVGERFLRTDCPLVGGDSGGPLFDLDGRVIGIHSRIGERLTANVHVPVDSYRGSWDRLVRGEVWGSLFPGGTPSIPFLGIEADPDRDDCRVKDVFAGSPAARGGIQVEDVIIRFDGHKIDSFEELRKQLGLKKVGDEVAVEVQRGGEVVVLKIVLGKRK
jgi:serine protease Do